MPAVLDLWARERSEHASTPDRLDDVGRLVAAFDDEAAGAFWEAAGYPADREIGRQVRNL